mgnify:CR=1 FL=1
MAKDTRHYLSPEWLESLVVDGKVDRSAALRVAQRINSALSAISNRLDAMERPNAEITGRIESFAVQGRQGLFHLTWIRVIEVDGYIIEMFTDLAATAQVGSWVAWGASTVQYQIPVGNVSITRYFRITPFLERLSGGLKLGTPSTTVTGTSVAYGAGEAAPTAPTVSPAPYTESSGLFQGKDVLVE